MIGLAPRHKYLRVVPAAVWMAIIFGLSSRSTIPTAPGFGANLTASAGHLVAYGVLGTLVLIALRTWFAFTWRVAAAAIVIAVLYGLTDEIHQSFVPGRDASAADLLLDAIGATIGVAILYRWRSKSGNR